MESGISPVSNQPALNRANQSTDSLATGSPATGSQAEAADKGTAPVNTPPAVAVRIDVKRLARLLFYALLLPAGVAIVFDFMLGLFPLLTLAMVVLVFPIAGFLVLRSTLREMSDVIGQVAPEEIEEPEAGEDEEGAAGVVSTLETEVLEVETAEKPQPENELPAHSATGTSATEAPIAQQFIKQGESLSKQK